MKEKSCQPEVTHALVGESYWKTEGTNRCTRITMFTVAAQQDVSNEKTQRKTTPLSHQHLSYKCCAPESWLLASIAKKWSPLWFSRGRESI